MKKNIIIIVLLLISFSFANAQHDIASYPKSDVRLSPFTRKFLHDYESITDKTSLFKTEMAEDFVLKKINGEICCGALLMVGDDFSASHLIKIGVLIGARAGIIQSVQIPVNTFEKVLNVPGIEYIQVDIPVEMMTNRIREESMVDSVHSGRNVKSPYDGSGVIVGVIDNGFDFKHPAFTNRIGKIWLQSFERQRPPDKFKYGYEIDGKKLSGESVNTDYQSVSHGTNVTQIAAGNGDYSNGKYKGMAPGAEILMVSIYLNSEESESTGMSHLVDAIKYVFDYADKKNKPAVVNMSLGNHFGPHDGTSLFELAIKNLAGQGRIIVASAGNSGVSDAHIRYEFNSEDEVFRTNIEYLENNSDANAYIDIWGEQGQEFSISYCLKYDGSLHCTEYYSTSMDKDIFDYVLSPISQQQSIVEIYFSSFEYNKKPRALLHIKHRPYSIGSYLSIKGSNGTLDLWNCGTGGSTAGDFNSDFTVENCIGGDNKSTISGAGANSSLVIAAGAYSTRERYISNQGGIISDPFHNNEGGLANFSSRGPAADNRTKPDISAPGSMILAALNSYSNANYTDSYTTDCYSVSGRTYCHGGVQGTSFSSPATAGAVALMLDANPKLDPYDVREILQKTAARDEFTGNITEEGSNDWGWGKLNAFNAVQEAENWTTETINKSNIRIGANPFDRGFSLYFRDIEFGVYDIKVSNLAGRIVWQTSINVLDQKEVQIDLSDKAIGVYFVKVIGRDASVLKKVIKSR